MCERDGVRRIASERRCTDRLCDFLLATTASSEGAERQRLNEQIRMKAKQSLKVWTALAR
jgi:hypothetical protein